MRNLMLVHLESLDYTNYQINKRLFPFLRKWEQVSLSFSKYFATATSTMMICSDLAYGGLMQYEPCDRMNRRLKKYCYKSSLLDELGQEGYRVKAFGYPIDESGDIVGGNKNHFIGHSVEMDVIPSYEEYLYAIDNAIDKEMPFVVWACNYISNVCYNCFIKEADHWNGLEKWENSYLYMDSCVKDLMDILERKKLLESTTVIFYGDHGDDILSHGKHCGLMHAIEPYESLIHTPFWIYDSRFAPTEIGSLIDTTDIRNVIRQLLDLPERNLKVEDLDLPARKYSLSRNAYAAQKVREASFHKAYSLTDGKFLFMAGDQGMELYHIEMDAGCQHNLLDYFNFYNDALSLNEAAYGRMKFHFRSIVNQKTLALIEQIFYEYRKRLMAEVEKLYQYAECKYLFLEIDFENIHYGWEEKERREQLTEYTLKTGSYEEFDVYDRYLDGKRVVLYGAGNYGKYFYGKLAGRVEIIAWVDSNYEKMPYIFGRKIQSPDCIGKLEFDAVFIAVASGRIRQKIEEELLCFKIPLEKIY